jgi:hypothetical protein
MRVNSLMVPPGIPHFYTRKRTVEAGTVRITGRAWSGSGRVDRVELGVDGDWRDAEVEKQSIEHTWQRWEATWDAVPGEHELRCRATDCRGQRQPVDPPWDLSGFGNNGVQRIEVTVRP